MYIVQDAKMTMGALIACVILGGRAIAPIGQSEGGTTFGWRASYPNNQGRLDFTIQCLDCP